MIFNKVNTIVLYNFRPMAVADFYNIQGQWALHFSKRQAMIIFITVITGNKINKVEFCLLDGYSFYCDSLHLNYYSLHLCTDTVPIYNATSYHICAVVYFTICAVIQSPICTATCNIPPQNRRDRRPCHHEGSTAAGPVCSVHADKGRCLW